MPLVLVFWGLLTKAFLLFRLKPEKLEKELDRYSDSAKRRGAVKMGLPEFAACLGVPESPALRDLFCLFDEVGRELQSMQRPPGAPGPPRAAGQCWAC